MYHLFCLRSQGYISSKYLPTFFLRACLHVTMVICSSRNTSLTFYLIHLTHTDFNSRLIKPRSNRYCEVRIACNIYWKYLPDTALCWDSYTSAIPWILQWNWGQAGLEAGMGFWLQEILQPYGSLMSSWNGTPSDGSLSFTSMFTTSQLRQAEAVLSPSLEAFKPQLDQALSNLVWPQSWPGFEQGLV